MKLFLNLCWIFYKQYIIKYKFLASFNHKTKTYGVITVFGKRNFVWDEWYLVLVNLISAWRNRENSPHFENYTCFYETLLNIEIKKNFVISGRIQVCDKNRVLWNQWQEFRDRNLLKYWQFIRNCQNGP